MAARQYIGARYVPRFMGTWVGTQIYEALDVADNGLGTSYIAKKTVPAGTALTNTEYWTVYGASSGAILDLQTRMSAAEEIIDTHGDELIAIDARLDAIEAPMPATLIIHDSYGTIDGNFIGHLQSLASFTLNTNLYKYGGGGCGLISGTTKYIEFLETAGEELASIKDQIQYIIVEGFQNDLSGTYGEMLAAAEAFTQMANTLFPNAKVCFVLASLLKNSSLREKTRLWQYAFNNAGGKNKEVYDLTVSLHNYAHNDNTNHPDTYNSRQLAVNILNCVYGNGVALPYSTSNIVTETYTADESITVNTGYNLSVKCDMVDGGIRVTPSGVIFKVDEGVAHGAPVVLGDYSGLSFISPDPNNNPTLAFDGLIVYGGATYACSITFLNTGKVRLLAPVALAAGNNISLTCTPKFIPWSLC